MTHPEHLLHISDAFDKYGTKLVTDACQEESKQWDSKYCIQNAEDFSSLSTWGNVTITWRRKGRQKGALLYMKQNTGQI